MSIKLSKIFLFKGKFPYKTINKKFTLLGKVGIKIIMLLMTHFYMLTLIGMSKIILSSPILGLPLPSCYPQT